MYLFPLFLCLICAPAPTFLSHSTLSHLIPSPPLLPILWFYFSVFNSNFYKYSSTSWLVSLVWFSSHPNSQIHCNFFKIPWTNGVKHLLSLIDTISNLCFFAQKSTFFLRHLKSTLHYTKRGAFTREGISNLV